MATDIKLPELGENLEEGQVLDVKVAAGATVQQGQPLLEVEAEKSTVEVPAPVSGRVAQVAVHKGDKVRVGQLLCTIEEGVPAQAGGDPGAPAAETLPVAVEKANGQETPAKALAARPAAPDHRAGPAAPPVTAVVPAGPATRRLARELNVDLAQVAGSARGGRVTIDDVKAHVRSGRTGMETAAWAAPPLPDFEKWGPVQRQPLEGIRKRTAEQMSLAWRLVPHVTQHDLADITDLDAFRRRQEEVKLTVTAFALKAAALALKQFPRFNASLDSAGNALVLKSYYHIGVAVDTEHGLLVPVLRDVDRKSVAALAEELTVAADRARQKKLGADDMRGGTFTITNLGGIGGTGFTPIVNWPEVAILGLSRGRWQPVIRDGQVVPRLLLPLCVSYDHRVIDGADAARFTRRLAQLLEDPLLMLL